MLSETTPHAFVTSFTPIEMYLQNEVLLSEAIVWCIRNNMHFLA